MNELVIFLLGFVGTLSVAGIVFFSYHLIMKSFEAKDKLIELENYVHSDIADAVLHGTPIRELSPKREVVLVKPKTSAPLMNFNEQKPEPYGWMDEEKKDEKDTDMDWAMLFNSF